MGVGKGHDNIRLVLAANKSELSAVLVYTGSFFNPTLVSLDNKSNFYYF